MTTPFVGTASGDGWRAWDRVNVEVDATGAARLARDPTPTYVAAEPVESLPSPIVAIDVGLTPLGELYALGRDRESGRPGLYRHVPDAGTLWRVPCFDDLGADATPETVLTDPRALCVTDDTLFVADGSGDLHAVSVHAYQHRWVRAGATADPVALATDGQRVFVLDRGDGTNGTVGRVGADGSVAVVRTGLVGARDLAVAPNGVLAVLLVADGSASVERFAPDGSAVTPLPAVGLPAPDCLVSGAAGALLVGGTDPTGGRTLVRYRPEADRFEAVPGIDVGWTALAPPGPGDGSADRYGVTEDGDLRRLEAARLTRPHPASGAHEGRLERRFDTGEPGTEWHRLSLDGDLSGPATAVRVRYRATDTDVGPEPLESVGGIGPTRADRLRAAGVSTLTDLAGLSPAAVAAVVSSPERPVGATEAAAWVQAATERAPAWTELEPAGADDALFEGAVGRYLHVRVELVGEPSASPVLRTLRGYFDRDSYLEYLPAVYREDERSAAFLGRFLAAFEAVFEEVESALDGSGRYFDPAGAPTEGLAWLAEWVGVDAEAAWPEAATRDLIGRAHDLHRRRGTPAGLLELVDVYVGHATAARTDDPGAVEDDTGGATPGDGVADGGGNGDDGTTPEHFLSLLEYPDLDVVEEPDAREPFERLLGGPGRFLVLLGAALDAEDERAVDRLVAGSTPAHTAGEVVHLRDRIRLGDHTYLGVNAALTGPAFRVDRSALGTDAVLEEREPAGQTTLRGRLDEESRLA
ncbi:MAG: phage tail protein [Haloarculaceae archaeon]